MVRFGEAELEMPLILPPRDRLRLNGLQTGDYVSNCNVFTTRHGASYELLAKQVEQLRALETRPVGHADVVDAPSLPHRSARPARMALVGEGGAAGLVLGALLALFLSWMRARGR